jgi:RNA polymerase sigma-70 factor (ECF subfamily)
VEVQEFEGFLAANYEPVRRALSLALCDPRRAEDVVQEAFARAFTRWSSVSAMERPVAWVYVVAMNQARRDLRREQRRARPAVAVAPPDMAGGVATSVSLTTALASLSPRQRTAVVLRFLADLSMGQVAEAMGCAEGTVKSTIHAALGRLRIEMEEDDQ